MQAVEIVYSLLAGRSRKPGTAHEVYAPANIALVKYWGKRDEAINLPVTGSLSVSMADRGTYATVEPAEAFSLWIDGVEQDVATKASKRMAAYLGLFGGPFRLSTRTTIPIGAGLASSASAFAAVVRALDALYGWDLDVVSQSILARLGSGSACRSVLNGFVEWRLGERADGMDSHALPIDVRWPSFRLGLIAVSEAAKPIGSREAMRHTRETAGLYAAWPDVVARDLPEMRAAIAARDLTQLGEVAEGNAMAMHATMIAARPSVCYWLEESLTTLRRVWALRADGLAVYATMDAGPNVKLLFDVRDEAAIRSAFPAVQVVNPFGA